MKSNFRFLRPILSPQPKLSTRACSHTGEVTEIKIPKRIPRSPTDILKALSGTVGIDPTAAHYKFHDDPYLMPYNNPSKRGYALSQEAGRKAAQWIRQQHSDLFQHKVAIPTVDAFVPKTEFSDESTVNEEVLVALIGKQEVSDVMTVYQIMKKRGLEIGVETKQKMLELMCFYNCQDPLSEEWVEENWFRQSTSGKKVGRLIGKSWKDDGFAEQLFEDVLSEGGDASRAHSAVISGMMTYGQVDRAWKLFEEAKQKGVEMDVNVYNAFLSKASHMRENHDLIWQFTLSIMTEMKELGIKPNLGTLNSILFTLEQISANRNSRQNAISTLAEFKNLGIEPSLESFGQLVRIFQRDKAQQSGAIRGMLERLEADSQMATVRSPGDNLFFIRTMEAIYNLGDREMAIRLDNILHKVKNYALVGNSFSESVYYRNYFLLMMNTDEVDEFMELYHKLVPHMYAPEPRVVMELLKVIEVQMGWKHISKMWSDIVMFDQVGQTGMIPMLLSVTVQAAEDPEHAESMADVGWSVWEKIESGTVRRLEWTGEALGDVLQLLVGGKQLAKAHIVMDRITRLQDSVTGEPHPQSLRKYVDACLENANIDAALKCVKYCDLMGKLETDELLKKITTSGLVLDGPQERVIQSLQKTI